MGAWIETFSDFTAVGHFYVAPYVGAWIETAGSLNPINLDSSHPTWVRGLKQYVKDDGSDDTRRTLRGCVD